MAHAGGATKAGKSCNQRLSGLFRIEIMQTQHVVGTRAQVAQAEPTDQTLEAVRPVTGAVVGQHTLEAHTQAAVIADRADQSLAGTDSALAQLDGGRPPASDRRWPGGRTLSRCPSADASGHRYTVARGADPAQLLDVQMQQLAGPSIFIAVFR